MIAAQPGSRQIGELRLRLALNEILGQQLGDACEEVHLRGSVLSLGISNPALAHQLRLDSGAVLQRLNALGVTRPLRELRVRTGRATRRE